MVASPVAGAAAGAGAPLVLAAGATALGSKYSLISASSSSTVLGLGRPARPALRPARPAALVAPPAAAAGLGAAAADLGLLFSFFAFGALNKWSDGCRYKITQLHLLDTVTERLGCRRSGGELSTKDDLDLLTVSASVQSLEHDPD